MQNRTLDWQSKHDEKSRDYPVSDLLTSVIVRWKKKKLWRGGKFRTDQGSEGACVGFAMINDLLARPNVVSLDAPNQYAYDLYKRAQEIDYWEGEDYEGTSVLAGAKALQEKGYIGEYRWAFSIEDIIGAVQKIGPVVIGIPWLSGMYQTKESGMVKVGGDVVGGHAILLTGYHPRMRIRGEGWFKRHEVFKWRNSWGESYGKMGDGYIKVEDLEYLLKDVGEACVFTERYTRPI